MNYLISKEVNKHNDRQLLGAAHKILAYHRTLQSVSHFNEVCDLDERVYFLTVTPQNIPLKEMRPQVYSEINMAINNSVYGFGPERAGLVIDDDVSGTRNNNPIDDNYHFHGMIFLPKLESGKQHFSLFDNVKISNALGKRSDITNVDCKRYVFGCPEIEGRTVDRSIAGLIGYGSKFVQKNSHEAFDYTQFESSVYPWFIDMKPKEWGRKKRLRRGREAQIRANYTNLLTKFYTNPSALFTARYMDRYGEEINRLCRTFPLGHECSILKAAA